MGEERILSGIQKGQTEAQRVNGGEIQGRANEKLDLTLLLIFPLVVIFHLCFAAKKLLIKTPNSLGCMPFACLVP